MERILSGRFGLASAVALAILLFGGCASNETDPSSSEQSPAVTESSGRDEADEASVQKIPETDVDLRVADEAELAAIVRAQRGKVVLVDYWATWCLPCVELFPHTVALQRRFRDLGLLTVVCVSFDDPQSEPQVRQFLAEKGATFQNLLSPYGVSPKAAEAFGIPEGGLPYLRLYDREGKIVRTFGGGGPLKAEDVDKAVQQLLEEDLPNAPNTL